jgi:predicted transcriptional regulator
MTNFPTLDSIGKRRRALGMTQQALAKAVEKSQSLIAKIEKKSAVPNYNTAVEIFEELERRESAGDRKANDIMTKKVITLDFYDSMEKAALSVRKYAISQFPVLKNGTLVGSIRAKDMLGMQKKDVIGSHLSDLLPTINKETPLNAVRELLKDAQAVIVVDRHGIIGIITPENLL